MLYVIVIYSADNTDSDDRYYCGNGTWSHDSALALRFDNENAAFDTLGQDNLPENCEVDFL